MSRKFNDAEKKYWPPEIKIAGLIWAVRKIRHIIESAYTTIIYTDHGPILGIAKQTSLKTSSSAKANLRIIQASQYLSQFGNLEIRHKKEKLNIVPDALSRLASETEADSEEGELEVNAFSTTIIQISDEFKDRIKDNYQHNVKLKKVNKLLTQSGIPVDKPNLEADRDSNPPPAIDRSTADIDPPKGIQFLRRNGLLFNIDDIKNRERLCIPQALNKDVFEMAHNINCHTGFHRAYSKINKGLFIPRLARKLKIYLKHCPACNLCQTKRHAPYGSLQPISRPPIFGHTVAMDFVLSMPEAEGHNMALIITDLWSKKVTIGSGKDNWGGNEWAHIMLDLLTDWGVPAAIISDRDAKFISDLWKAI